MDAYIATDALKALSGFLARYYGKKVIILLDEYDTPMQEAYFYGYWEKMAAFTRSLFNATPVLALRKRKFLLHWMSFLCVTEKRRSKSGMMDLLSEIVRMFITLGQS